MSVCLYYHKSVMSRLCVRQTKALCRQQLINTRVTRKKRERDPFELGIPLSSLHCFEAQEKPGDRIKDGVRNGIKDGREGEGSGELFLSLGTGGCSEIPSLVHTDSDAKPVIMIPLRVCLHVCVCS